MASLFKIERTLREEELPLEQFAKRRREQVQPVFEKLCLWLDERESQIPPSTTLGKAIGYARGQWPKLIRYLDSPLLGPDNNACERAIRPFVVGRNYAESIIMLSRGEYPAKYSEISAVSVKRHSA